MIEKLKKYDQIFSQNEFQGQIDKSHIFRFEDRKTKVIFSAPHATRTFVKKQNKLSDLYTGAITLLLGESGFSTIVRTKFVPKKEHIIDFIKCVPEVENKFFIDVHGMKQAVPFEVAIGTGHLPTQIYQKDIELIQSLCEKYNISWTLNHPDYHAGVGGFTAKYQERFNKKNIIQIEFRKDMRDFYDHPKNVLEKTIPFLLDLAKHIEEAN